MQYPSGAALRRIGEAAVLCLTLGAAVLRTETARAATFVDATYYASATGTGETLKQQLFAITVKTFTVQNYGDARYFLGTLWADPTNAGKQFSAYSGTDMTAAWDSASGSGTWNREHIATEDSLGISVTNTYTGYGADMFEVAPTINQENSDRSNYGYGYTGSTSTPTNKSPTTDTSYGVVTGTDGNKYWYAGTKFRGDLARSLFYMATRYGYNQNGKQTDSNVALVSGDSGNKYNLTLANGVPNTSGQMGDLNTLLHWAYEDPVDTFERNKNTLVYSGLTGTDGNAYKQGNRNPYIDHPEYIWAVFGTKANTSQLSVATAASSGASSVTINVGRAIAGTAFKTSTATITKTGDTPTTFNVVSAGSATSSLTGTGETFTYDAGSKSMTVGLSTASTAGAVSGTVMVDNTDLTSSGTGTGSADGNDVVTVTGTAVDHSDASFATASDSKRIALSFGTLSLATGVHTLSFLIANRLTASGYTAGLDLDSITGTGSTSALYTNAATFSSETAGTNTSFLADLSTTSAGVFSAEYTLAVSDENIPGATAGQSLILDLTGTVVAPEPASIAFLSMAGVFLLRRPRRVRQAV